MASDWQLADWRKVVGRHRDPHPCLTDWWQRAWWETFAEGELDVIRLDDGSGLAGVAALRTCRNGVVRLLGNREVTDYPAVAVEPGRERNAADCLIGRMRHAGWARLELDNQRGDAPFTAAIIAASQTAGMTTAVTPAEAVAILTLPAERGTWQHALGRHARHELARKRRRLDRACPHAQLRTSDATRLARDIDAFMGLHRSSAGAKGSFMTPRNELFVRRVVAAAHEAGSLRLDVLEPAGEPPLAIALGFVSGVTYYLYNMAFDPDARALSPGIVLVAGLIERAIADGLARFDFLRGLERYKLAFGAIPHELVRVEVADR